VDDGLAYRDGGDQEARDNEEDWNEQSLADEFQLFLRGVALQPFLIGLMTMLTKPFTCSSFDPG
jgi:hypothetical protein